MLEIDPFVSECDFSTLGWYAHDQFPVSNVNLRTADRFVPGVCGLSYCCAPLVCIPSLNGFGMFLRVCLVFKGYHVPQR